MGEEEEVSAGTKKSITAVEDEKEEDDTKAKKGEEAKTYYGEATRGEATGTFMSR